MSYSCHKITVLTVTAAAIASLPLTVHAGRRSTFLSDGPSAIAYGRGQAAVSSFTGPSTLFYNPALLATLSGSASEFSHTLLTLGSIYDFAGYARGSPNEKTSFAFSVIRLGSGETILRERINDPGTSVHVSQWAGMMTAARPLALPLHLTAGVSVVYVYQDLIRSSGGGAGLDAGLAGSVDGMRIAGEDAVLLLGLSVKNLLPPRFTLSRYTETYPVIVRTGASCTIPVYNRLHSRDTVTICADLSYEDSLPRVFWGMEYGLLNRFIIRAGAFPGHITAGGGLKAAGFQFDYAADFNDYALIHRLSIARSWSHQKSSPAQNALLVEARAALREERQRVRDRDATVRPLLSGARDHAHAREYLYASEIYRDIIARFPEYAVASRELSRIEQNMKQDATGATADFRRFAYADGYINFTAQEYANALRAFERALQAEPNQPELREFSQRAASFVRASEKSYRDRRAAASAEDLLKRGDDEYDLGSYIASIKTMETLKVFCSTSSFTRSNEFLTLADERISRSVAALKAEVTSTRRPPAPVRQSPANAVISHPLSDPAGAERAYREGLIRYARGKRADALLSWELALRLDPGHERSRTAIERVRFEIENAR